MCRATCVCMCGLLVDVELCLHNGFVSVHNQLHAFLDQNLEAEVNINLPLTLSGDSSGQFLLSCQLRRLQVRVHGSGSSS